MLDKPPEYRVKDLSIGYKNRKLYDNITRHLSKMKYTSYLKYKNGPSAQGAQHLIIHFSI